MRRPALRSPRLGARGFTLIEVLVALLILSVMAGMAWTGVDALLRSRQSTADRGEDSVVGVIGHARGELDRVLAGLNAALAEKQSLSQAVARLAHRTVQDGVHPTRRSADGPRSRRRR